MLEARYNCQKLLNVTPPTNEILKILNNRGGSARWKFPKTLLLNYRKHEITGDRFSFEEGENIVVFSAGRQTLAQLKECFQKFRREIDYSIEIGDTAFWFW